MWLLLLFVAIPMIEIALFIQVGGAIGLGWTLAIVLFTAILGTWLVRQQGALALNDLRNSFSQLSDPTEPLAHGAMILFAGALLLTPGFFTDASGLALLIPPVRRAVYGYLRKRITVRSFSMGPDGAPRHPGFDDRGGPAYRGADDVIDGDFEEVDTANKRPTHRPQQGPSGWTKH